MQNPRSLASRIFLASIVLMPLVLGFSAFMLERAFRQSLYSAEESSLLANTYSMMAVAEPDASFLVLPETLTDSRFNDPESGLYAQVVDEEYGPVWQSISLSISPLAQSIPSLKVPTGLFDVSVSRIDDEDYFISRFTTVWEIDEEDQQYQFVVIHSQAQLREEISRYRRTLAGWLGGLALILIVLQTVIIRWGLFPLRRLADDIKQLEAGAITALDKDYPEEIVPVTHNINVLINSEEQQRKRYQNTLGDLAHSLKTPLSVIRSVLEKQNGEKTAPWREPIDEQIERMSGIIGHQLARANRSKASFLGSVNIEEILGRIANALGKVYRDKGVIYIANVEPDLLYRAQEGDMMEVCGNLLENAFKYGHSKVELHAKRLKTSLEIRIADDGPGVPADMRTEILQRGARLDTTIPGQGIGLAVAADIVSTYDGGIRVEDSHLGGACFVITLPVS